MKIVPLSVKDAEAFLAKFDRHYKQPVEAICAIGLAEIMESPSTRETILHGAAILGRRADGDAELAHIYCNGVSHGYTLLYGAVFRTFKAMGYERMYL